MSGRIPPRIAVHGLSFELGGQRLLHDISFDIADGDYCCIIGPNGAGKSTLLKCLDGIYETCVGHIDIGGVPLSALTARQRARAVGYVPQSKGMLPDYTVREFLRMSRFARDDREQDDVSVEHALAQVGMASFAHRLLSTLSGGECQKAFIAAGLVQDAPLLLLDEPLSFLDPQFQVQIEAMLRSLNRTEGKTVVCVTHDLNDALRNATTLIALKRGRVAFIKRPAEVWGEKALDDLFETPFQYIKNSETGRPMVMLD